MEDENYIVRLPIVDLNVPQELIELIPHIDEDFYKSIGSEETKEVIQACTRSSTMNYSPLNENITSAAKNTDATLYGIQIYLVQATRPLHNFVYSKCMEDSEAAKEVEEVALVSAMRLILASIATNISQSQMENMYQAMNIPGKPKQLAVNAEKPLFGKELLNKAISTIKPVKKARLRKPFQISQQYDRLPTIQLIHRGFPPGEEGATRFPSEPPSWGPTHNVQESLGATHGQLVGQKNCREGVHDSIHEPETAPTTDYSSSPVQEEAESGIQLGTDRGNSLLIIEENRAAEASLGYKKPIQVCSGKELQDGVSQLHLKFNKDERLYDVVRSERRLPPHPDTQSLSKVLTFHLEWPTVPVQSTAIRPITLAAHLYQGATTRNLLGTENGDQNSSLLGRPPDYRRIKGTMQVVYHRGSEQAHETWVPGKLRQVGDSADTNDKSPVNDHKLPRDDSQ
ncbi:hypothetical protein AYI69_g10704, partial [Smittium culicis]